jgi:hypothetical protein
MDSGIHALIIAQHVQARMDEARSARTAREFRRGRAGVPRRSRAARLLRRRPAAAAG